jgi:ferredoxin
MQVHIDPAKCKTVGLCVQICPKVFKFTAGSKKATTAMERIPPSLENLCREAAARCPECAIEILE